MLSLLHHLCVLCGCVCVRAHVYENIDPYMCVCVCVFVYKTDCLYLHCTCENTPVSLPPSLPPPPPPSPFVDLGLGTSNSRGKGAELAVGVANAYLCVRMWSICVRLCTSVCIYVHTLHIYPIYMHTAVHNRTHVHHALHTGMHLATPNIEYISTFKYPLCAHTYPRQNLALATPNIN